MKKKIYLLILLSIFNFIAHSSIVSAAESLDELSPCENPEILRVIFFARIIVDIVRTIIPVAMVIMAIIDFSKGITANDESSQKKKTKLLIKRIIMGVMIFIIPWIVARVISLLGSLTKDVNYLDCIANANEDKIEELQVEYDRLLEKEKNHSGGNSMEDNYTFNDEAKTNIKYSDEIVSNLAAHIASESGLYKDGFEAQLLTGAVFLNNMYYPNYTSLGYTPISSPQDVTLENMCKTFKIGQVYKKEKCNYRLNESKFPGINESQKKQATIAAKLVLSGIFSIPKEINGQGNLSNWGSGIKWGTMWTGKPECTIDEHADNGCGIVYAYSKYLPPSSHKDVFGSEVSTNFEDYKSISNELYQKYVVGGKEIF